MGRHTPRFLSDDEKRDKVRDKELNACLAQDCTGLIPSAIKDENQAESYEELYPFMSKNKDE